METRAWQATGPRGRKESDTAEQITHTYCLKDTIPSVKLFTIFQASG